MLDSSYDNKEILSCISILLSGHLTMGRRVKEFENRFCEHLGSSFSVMVNSGSSANLLAFSALTNPTRKRHLSTGDKVAVPAVCWSTSIWPIVQTGLVPVMVDVNPKTLNVSIPSLKRAIAEHSIRAVMLVHVLGNATEMEELLELVRDNDLLLVEDTCESLGTTYRERYLGTYGDFGTFSFYFSHHMTTIEGGIVTAKNQEDADLLRCLRTHGWSREQSNREEIEAANQHIDPRFLFINAGYNLRPMEIQAAFGIEQILRLDEMNATRRENFVRIKETFQNHPQWKNQLLFPEKSAGVNPCWFGFPFLINDNCRINRTKLAGALSKSGIDTRPIISGNMALQPAIQLFKIDTSLGPFEGAQTIHDRGLFIGCHSKPLDRSVLENLVSTVIRHLA